MDIIIISILLILVIILGFISYNLLIKNEKQEDILSGYLDYLDNISRVIEISDKKVKEINHSGSFSSDDEIGFFFKSIKDIQDILNDFQVRRIK